MAEAGLFGGGLETPIRLLLLAYGVIQRTDQSPIAASYRGECTESTTPFLTHGRPDIDVGAERSLTLHFVDGEGTFGSLGDTEVLPSRLQEQSRKSSHSET
jgi:hypothetical protein